MIKVETYLKMKENEIDLDSPEFTKEIESTKNRNIYRKYICIFKEGDDVEMLAVNGVLYGIEKVEAKK